jgi:peptidoglycan-associated lipoprotein
MWIALALVLVVPAMLFTASCAKKAVGPTTTTEKKMTDEAAKKAEEEAARQRALEEQRLKEARQAREEFVNEMIHFAFDSSALDATAQDILKKKAGYLQAHPDVKIVIEGHCDERGTIEYNLALGERRAQAARAFLENMGIASNRLDIISYGEERPLDPGHNEAAWAKNRRDQFIIK